MNTWISRALVLFLSSSLTLACGSEKGDGDKAGKPTAAKADPAAAATFDGKLTEELLMKANRTIQLYNADTSPADFAPAFATAKKTLGEPTHSQDNLHAWGFVAGDKCTYYALENKDGKADSPGAATVDKLAGGMYEDCMKALGKAAPAAKTEPAPPAKPAKP